MSYVETWPLVQQVSTNGSKQCTVLKKKISWLYTIALHILLKLKIHIVHFCECTPQGTSSPLTVLLQTLALHVCVIAGVSPFRISVFTFALKTFWYEIVVPGCPSENTMTHSSLPFSSASFAPRCLSS